MRIYDPNRERALLNRVSELAGEEHEASARVMFSLLMELSRSYQSKIILPKSKYEDVIASAIQNTDKLFPERTNVEFATILADGKVRMRVWERGSGITQACGTGACATAVASILHHLSHRTVTVIMDGGPLEIEWRESDNHVYMTGPACIVFEGTIEMNNHIEKTNGE